MRRVGIGLALAAALAALSLWTVRASFGDPVRWTPDALFYQARLLQIRGAEHDAAFSRAFRGPLSERLRRHDPTRTGNAAWVAYNERFYERRQAVPLAGAALYPAAGDRSLLYVSLAGYVAAILALFGLLALRFRLAIAAAATLAAVFLPALSFHSAYPLTDSWGLALQTAALAAALLTLDRGPRWLVLWVAAVVLLSFTRDSTWIPVLGAAWVAYRTRTRLAAALFGTGVIAALPAFFLYSVPLRELLAFAVNGLQPPPETSWSFIAEKYPAALLELVRSNGGLVRDGEWYTGAYLAGGILLLFLLARRGPRDDVAPALMKAATVVSLGYVLAVPSFSAFRIELIFVPMAAFGLAALAERLVVKGELLEHLRLPALLPGRSSQGSS
jgi:hypothetical protein